MRTTSLFFASGNQGKILEVRQILQEILPEVSLFSLQDFPGWAHEVEECGQDYHANALLKCEAFINNPRAFPVIADDSGLEVAAFPGLLGVHSHRWCQQSGYQIAAEALLHKMDAVANRSAVFHTTFCYLPPQGQPHFFDADLPGKIATALSGHDGFDFDPIFIPDGFDKPYADIGQQTKNRISQRRQALEQLAAFLKDND